MHLRIPWTTYMLSRRITLKRRHSLYRLKAKSYTIITSSGLSKCNMNASPVMMLTRHVLPGRMLSYYKNRFSIDLVMKQIGRQAESRLADRLQCVNDSRFCHVHPESFDHAELDHTQHQQCDMAATNGTNMTMPHVPVSASSSRDPWPTRETTTSEEDSFLILQMREMKLLLVRSEIMKGFSFSTSNMLPQPQPSPHVFINLPAMPFQHSMYPQLAPSHGTATGNQPSPPSYSHLRPHFDRDVVISRFLEWGIFSTVDTDTKGRWEETAAIVLRNDWSLDDLKMMKEMGSSLYSLALREGITDGRVRSFDMEIHIWEVFEHETSRIGKQG
jgi:hypothetical protein